MIIRQQIYQYKINLSTFKGRLMHRQEESFMQEQQDLNDLIYLVRHDLQLNRYIQKPKLRMRTQYENRFTNHQINTKRMTLYEQPIMRPQSVAPFRTQYNTNYQSCGPQTRYSVKKEEIISSDSPFLSTTTYRTNFIGHRGANQYVKIKTERVKNNIRFNDRTTYNQTFKISNQTQNYAKTQTKQRASSVSSHTDRKIRRKTAKSTYDIDFDASKYKNMMNPETKAHDYSSLFIFSTSGKKKLKFKTQCQTQITKNIKIESTKPNKLQKVVKYEKSDFKKYQIKQVNQLKKRLKTTLG